MSTSRFKMLEEVFAVAATLEGSQRVSYLDEVCAGDETLRTEVEDLLLRDEHKTARIQRAVVAGTEGVLDDQNINDVVSVAIEFGGPYKRNCEDYWHDCGDKSKSTAQTFWGFDDRDDCMKYYKKMGKIWPLTSTGLIMTGAVGQATFSFLHMYYAVAATNF